MARMLAKVLRISGTLVAQLPLHVGGADSDIETDMPLARDGEDRFYVPGTALAGPLRAWMEQIFDSAAWLNNLWGFQPEDDSKDETQDGCASRVFVENAVVQQLPNGLTEEIWDGVGIDRQWGAAAPGVKFDRMVLPRDTCIPLDMTVELPAEESTAQAMRAALGYLVQALCDAAIPVGAGSTRGLGKLKLTDPVIKEEDWSTPAGILTCLRGTPDHLTPEALIGDAPTVTPHKRAILEVEIHWRPVGPVMVKAGQDGVAVDMVPMVTGHSAGKLALVLPGSSLKGALRQQAERIVRTVLKDYGAVHAWVQEEPRQRLLEQVRVPLAEDLFGIAKRDSKNAGRRGALWVATCYANNGHVDPEHWRAVTTAPLEEKVPEESQGSKLYQALWTAELRNRVRYDQAFHVAVDRWTGGAADGFLYSTLEPFGVQWEPICLQLELERLKNDLCWPAVTMLLLLLCDLAQDRIPLGFGGNRGYGSIKVDKVKFTCVADGNFSWLNNEVLTGDALQKGDFSGLENLEKFRVLEKKWHDWIVVNRKQSDAE